ncbi:MAG: hypothetical protein R3C01_13770 [Planctomycetaceae bacterium]
MTQTNQTVDFIDELRLRRWARENYVASQARSVEWHDVVHSEMNRRYAELAEQEEQRLAPTIVPLAPYRFDSPHPYSTF